MMFKKLWKLVRSDEKLAQALNQRSVVYDLSPDIAFIPANDEPQLKAPTATTPGPKPKLWLEDWSERDEERLKCGNLHWEGYIS